MTPLSWEWQGHSWVRFGRAHPALVAGLVVVGAVLLFGVLGPLIISPAGARLGAAVPSQPPSAAHLLGTDAQGRDVLAALVQATPETLKIGLLAALVGLTVGTSLGMLSGYFGGGVDTVIRVLTDVLITIPGLAVLVLFAANLRVITVELMALIIASLAWMYPARAIRAQTLSLRERGYVQIARLNGVGGLELVFREVLPNLVPYIAASSVTTVSAAILSSIGLEALGLGPQNTITLGLMIYFAQFYGAILRGMWWWWGPPIAVIVLIFLGLLLISSGMDRLLDVRLRRTP